MVGLLRGELTPFSERGSTVLLAWGLKCAYWCHIDEVKAPSTPESATGLGHLGAVRLLDPPHTGTNFLMTEMGYRVAQTHAAKLRRMAFVTGIAVPFVLTVTAMSATGIVPAIAAILAALSAAIGVLIERWLFFAEAKHVVMLYYGESG